MALFRRELQLPPIGLLSDDDAGKSVFDEAGNLVGEIIGVEDGEATVKTPTPTRSPRSTGGATPNSTSPPSRSTG